MPELLVDFITSLDGYGAADGWPGWWGLEGPEYLTWLGDQPEADFTVLMGATTYRLMYGFAAAVSQVPIPGRHVEGRVLEHLDRARWSGRTRILVTQDPVEAVREMKATGARSCGPWAASPCVARC